MEAARENQGLRFVKTSTAYNADLRSGLADVSIYFTANRIIAKGIK